MQVVASGADGNVAASDIRGRSYKVEVTGNPVKLTAASVTLNNALRITTGQDAEELGDVSAAAGLAQWQLG